jgi:hypothetical protein
MAIFTVYICDALGSLKATVAPAVQAKLKEYFSKITEGSYDSCEVKEAASGQKLEENELLVFFMPPGLSIAASLPGATAKPDTSSDGFTIWTTASGAVSEVYAKTSLDAEMLAKLAFHELMHNKLRLGEKLHDEQDGLGAKEISASSVLTAKNISGMKAALPNKTLQWVAGVAVLTTGKNDPLSPFYRI